MDNTIKGFIKFILNSVSGSAKANGITETLAKVQGFRAGKALKDAVN